MHNEQVPHPHVVAKNWEGYLDCRGLPGEARGPNHTPGPPAQDSGAGKTTSYGNQEGWWLSETEGCCSPRYFSEMAPTQT